MARLLFVLLDGLNDETAERCMSGMRALVDAGQARKTALTCGLPPLSRPIYAALLSGFSPAKCGILHNDDARLCPAPTFFQHASRAGLRTAAAAHYWISELCNAAPFEPARDRLTINTALPVAHGLFYCNDAYPDDEVFHDAEALCHNYSPDLLLVHSMGIDWAGHGFGAHSAEYRQAAREADGLLARFLPRRLAEGYTVLVTADHGMDSERNHYDHTDEVRRVPFWLTGTDAESFSLPTEQTDIAALVTRILGIASPSASTPTGN